MISMNKRSFAIAGLIVIAGGSLLLGNARTSKGQVSPPPPPDTITEVDTSSDFVVPIENGPPGYVLDVQRASDGTRTVTLFDGTTTVTLVSGQFVLHASAVWAGGATTVCAQIVPDYPNPTNMYVQCGVHRDGSAGFDSSTTMQNPGTNTFFQDICMPGSASGLSTVTFATGDNPLLSGGSPSPDMGNGAPCQSVTYYASGGGVVSSSPVSDGCLCDTLNGQPCPADPCWQGSGIMSGGVCDHSTQTPSCPAPQQCSGDPTALCFDPTNY
jgi:hypothetical protein